MWYNFSEEAEEAKFLCNSRCSLGTRACLMEYGDIPHGIVGGLTPTERVLNGWR